MKDVETFSDVSDEFDSDYMGLYNDAPIYGRLRNRSSGGWFAFYCEEVVVGAVWHWVLVPWQDDATDPLSVLRRAAASSNAEWWSVIEDARGEHKICKMVKMSTSRAKPIVPQ